MEVATADDVVVVPEQGATVVGHAEAEKQGGRDVPGDVSVSANDKRRARPTHSSRASHRTGRIAEGCNWEEM